MSKIIDFPRNVDLEVAAEPQLQVPIVGISEYPHFAERDFNKAFKRFFVSVDAITPDTREEAKQAEIDRMRYSKRFSHFTTAKDDLLVSFEEIEAFVLLVTGYPRYWYAAWHYDQTVTDLMAEGRNDQEAQEMINEAYAEAISVSLP